MGRVDEEHMARPRLGGVQARLQLGLEEIGLGLDVLGQVFLGGTGIGADPLEFQAHVLEELAHLAGTASQSGQLKDAFARLGHGAGGLLLEGLADQVAIGGHLAHRAIGVPPPQAVQAPVSERGHVPLDGGPTDADDLGRLLARDPVVQQPEDEHLLPDPRVGMRGPFLVDDPLLLLGQLHAKPSHGVPRAWCGTSSTIW